MAVQSLNPFAVGADVFVYRRTDGVWNIEAQLMPGADVTRGRGFGFALQVSGGRVIVGDSSAWLRLRRISQRNRRRGSQDSSMQSLMTRPTRVQPIAFA
jgi:hypothetical protein